MALGGWQMGRRSFGSVRRLPSGRFQVRYFGPDGFRRTASDTFATKGDAARWLARTETDVARGQWLNPAAASVTLREYAEGWLLQRTVKGRPLAPRTVQTYRHSLDAHVLLRLGDYKLAGITPALVRTWHAETLARTGPTAARQAYATLRAILNTAVDDDAIHRNPCRITGADQPSSPERPLLDLETVEALAAAMPTHFQTLCLVTFWAHLRIGEVVALQRRDVDIRRGKIRIERQHVELRTGPLETEPKAASRRTVHLPAQALEVLSAHLADRPGLPTAPVFTRADGSLLRASHVQNAWTTARKRVGADHAHFHDLRHAGLTLTAQLGATTAEVMRRAGHSSARAANIYQHAAEGRDIAIAKLLSAVEGTGQPADWKHNAGS